MTKRCYYESLSIERTASDGDIKAAFRKQAMVCHPDRNPGDKDAEHRFKEINEAYEVLKDPDKRAAYDRYGHAAFEQGTGAAAKAGFDIPKVSSPSNAPVRIARAAASRSTAPARHVPARAALPASGRSR